MLVKLLIRTAAVFHPQSFYSPLALTRSFGSKKKGGKGHKDDREPEVENDFDLDVVKTDMEGVVEKYQERLSKLKLGRLDPKILDDIRVTDKSAKLKDLAQIVPRSSVEFFVKLFDPKNLDSALNAIATSNMQLSARKDSLTSFIVNVPKANEEVKNEMVKEAKQMCEQTKNAIRKHRLSALQTVKKIKSVGEDENRRMQKQIQTVSEQFCTKADHLLKEKESQIQQS